LKGWVPRIAVPRPVPVCEHDWPRADASMFSELSHQMQYPRRRRSLPPRYGQLEPLWPFNHGCVKLIGSSCIRPSRSCWRHPCRLIPHQEPLAAISPILRLREGHLAGIASEGWLARALFPVFLDSTCNPLKAAAIYGVYSSIDEEYSTTERSI